MLVEHGLISPDDLLLFQYAETAREAWDLIVSAKTPSAPPE